jgi:CRP-like cAMP-binding protein
MDGLAAALRPITLESGQTVFEPEQAVDRVIFPQSGLLSIISVMASGAVTETAMVGRDGAIGFIEACGSGRIFSRVLVQVAGTAWSVPASRYRALFDASRTFRVAIATNIELQLAECRQNMACNSLHLLDRRLARWLLDCRDISGCGAVLPLTHEFLGAMLSAQRSTISTMTHQFEAEGLIRQGRGKITLLDIDALEHRSCECRTTIAALRAHIQPRAAPL